MSKQNVSIMGSWTDTCFSSVRNRIGNKALKNKQLFACRLAKQVLDSNFNLCKNVVKLRVDLAFLPQFGIDGNPSDGIARGLPISN